MLIIQHCVRGGREGPGGGPIAGAMGVAGRYGLCRGETHTYPQPHVIKGAQIALDLLLFIQRLIDRGI